MAQSYPYRTDYQSYCDNAQGAPDPIAVVQSSPDIPGYASYPTSSIPNARQDAYYYQQQATHTGAMGYVPNPEPQVLNQVSAIASPR
jgi:hypothetical protein